MADVAAKSNTQLSLVTGSPEQTRAVGAALAGRVQPGDVILLSGSLGAGKTVFVRGLAAGLGSSESVTSPTFVLLRELGGRIPLKHADLYRLDRVQEVIDLDLDDLFDRDSVTAVEWGEAALPVVAGEYLKVVIEFVARESARENRRLLLEPVGQDWEARLGELHDSLRCAAEAS